MDTHKEVKTGHIKRALHQYCTEHNTSDLPETLVLGSAYYEYIKQNPLIGSWGEIITQFIPAKNSANGRGRFMGMNVVVNDDDRFFIGFSNLPPHHSA